VGRASPSVRTTGGPEGTTTDPKSAASRRVVPVEAIHRGTIAALRALRRAQAEQRLAAGGRWASDLVVVDAAGQGVHPDAYGERFRELRRAAGVPVIRLHAVRHTLASALHDAGEPPAAVARFLGHTVGTHLQFTSAAPTTARHELRCVSGPCWRRRPVRRAEEMITRTETS
jgi:integrase